MSVFFFFSGTSTYLCPPPHTQVATAQEGELASLEEIVSQLTQKAVVALPVVDALWSLIAGQGVPRPAVGPPLALRGLLLRVWASFSGRPPLLESWQAQVGSVFDPLDKGLVLGRECLATWRQRCLG